MLSDGALVVRSAGDLGLGRGAEGGGRHRQRVLRGERGPPGARFRAAQAARSGQQPAVGAGVTVHKSEETEVTEVISQRGAEATRGQRGRRQRSRGVTEALTEVTRGQRRRGGTGVTGQTEKRSHEVTSQKSAGRGHWGIWPKLRWTVGYAGQSMHKVLARAYHVSWTRARLKRHGGSRGEM